MPNRVSTAYQPIGRITCNGCPHYKETVKLRTNRIIENYWDCAHPKSIEAHKDGLPRPIGSGASFALTPTWCPLTPSQKRKRNEATA